MNALIKLDDIILAPHYSTILLDKLQNYNARETDILGIMVKIADEGSGKVRENYIEKYSTSKDVSLLTRGSAIAGAILKKQVLIQLPSPLHLQGEPIPVELQLLGK